ncbi:MAG: DUF4412 domain-containing protein [Bacteroidia bacterium]|nr:DUF4412 domain-containing protein [Bacteroidia bacterium]
MRAKKDSSGFEGSIVYKLEVGGREGNKIAFMNGRKFIYHFKGPFVLGYLVDGDSLGSFLGKVLIRWDSGYVYHIFPHQKEIQFHKLSAERATQNEYSLPLKFTGQRAYIQGYECSLWVANLHMRKTTGRTILQLWVSKDIIPSSQKNFATAVSTLENLFWISSNFYGFPLKKRLLYLDAGLEIIFTAEKIIPSSLPPALFELPDKFNMIPLPTFPFLNLNH